MVDLDFAALINLASFGKLASLPVSDPEDPRSVHERFGGVFAAFVLAWLSAIV